MTRDPTPPSPTKNTNKSSAAYLKRREQVRRAQRTHRERKETYIHALESVVLALRIRAKSVQEQNDELSRQVDLLKSRVDGQSAGSEVWGAAWGTGGDGVRSMGLEVDGEETGLRCVGSCQGKWLGASPDLPRRACDALTSKSEIRNWSISADYADMAMEFVLTLEKPCVMWAQAAVFDPLNAYPSEYPAHHDQLALYHAFVEERLVKSRSCSQEDVANSLDDLLKLSSAFDLEAEVTPIQAWQYLCGFFELGAVDMNGLRTLAGLLLEQVRCYGFGAVVPRNVLDATCKRAFTTGT